MMRRVHDKDDDAKILPRLRAFFEAKATAKEVDALFDSLGANKGAAAEDTADADALVSCLVSPGFDFADFELA